MVFKQKSKIYLPILLSPEWPSGSGTKVDEKSSFTLESPEDCYQLLLSASKCLIIYYLSLIRGT